jgi:DNA-binding GntR family transcriptional regulator
MVGSGWSDLKACRWSMQFLDNTNGAVMNVGEGVGRYRSLTQIIVETLRERILNGEYDPGARLSIAELAQKFDVSPVPVREALRNLETEGLVTFRLNRGVIVRDLSATEVRELFLLRTPLEVLAATEALRWVTPEAVTELREILNRMSLVAGQEDWHHLHNQFHDRFCSLSRLPRLIQIVTVLRGQMRPYSKVYLTDPEHLKQAHDEHCEMVDLLVDQDAARLQALIRKHLSRPARLALKALGAEAMPLDHSE